MRIAAPPAIAKIEPTATMPMPSQSMKPNLAPTLTPDVHARAAVRVHDDHRPVAAPHGPRHRLPARAGPGPRPEGLIGGRSGRLGARPAGGRDRERVDLEVGDLVVRRRPARYRSTSALRAMPTKIGVRRLPAAVTRIVPRRVLWKSQPGPSEPMSSPLETNPYVGVVKRRRPRPVVAVGVPLGGMHGDERGAADSATAATRSANAPSDDRDGAPPLRPE